MSEVIFLGLRILLAAALYAFLGLAIWVLWRDLRQAPRAAEEPIPPLNITITLEGETQSRQFTLPEVIIGRSPQSQCRLPSNTVSTRHARLFFRQGHWWIEDLGSTNGTFLNADPLTKATIVVSGDKIRCGEAELVIAPESEIRE